MLFVSAEPAAPIQPLIDSKRRAAVLILPDPGRRTLRFLFRYMAEFRAICWMKVGSDGSLYLNPRTGGERILAHADGIADGLGGFTQLTCAEPDGSVAGTWMVSYHASGWVRVAQR